MNDTVATEDQEQPAGCHQRKARVADRDPGRRTSSGPADICSAPTEAGHMTAANQIVRSAKKVLAMEGRPHMTKGIGKSPSGRILRFGLHGQHVLPTSRSARQSR